MSTSLVAFTIRRRAVLAAACCVGLGLTPNLLADTKIQEVQLDSYTAPSELIIWGTDFFGSKNELPTVYLGTDPTPLEFSASQALCSNQRANPAPPLDPDDADCIVVELPLAANGAPAVPVGDYLLRLEAGSSACSKKRGISEDELVGLDTGGGDDDDDDDNGEAIVRIRSSVMVRAPW